jgi:hypothetical protein
VTFSMVPRFGVATSYSQASVGKARGAPPVVSSRKHRDLMKEFMHSCWQRRYTYVSHPTPKLSWEMLWAALLRLRRSNGMPWNGRVWIGLFCYTSVGTAKPVPLQPTPKQHPQVPPGVERPHSCDHL